MKSIDVRSESAVKLLSEFLDMDAQHTADGKYVNAEHFAHGQLGCLLPHDSSLIQMSLQRYIATFDHLTKTYLSTIR